MSQSEPMIVVSVDTHAGPRLQEDLRPYCPSEHLDEFDRFAGELSKMKAQFSKVAAVMTEHPNFQTAGHHDSAARLADYDYDGVAAGVMFHGSQNFEPIPFQSMGFGADGGAGELAWVGKQIYNRWQVDFVSQAPHRHIGLAYLPLWDQDAAIAELEWAHDNGLKGVNFPAMREGELTEYNHPSWEPFWAACEERGMPLITHVGGGSNAKYTGPEASALMQMETGGFFSRRGIWWMIFGGVFERHPDLKIVIVETPGSWLPTLAEELDVVWNMYGDKREMNQAFFDQVPRPPSEYVAKNVFFGASFASHYEAEQAAKSGLESQMMWGSDYPHIEGTFVYAEDKGMPSVTKLALRNTFYDVAPEKTRQILGENAIGVYNLDKDALTKIASKIGPTPEEIAQPIDAKPELGSRLAFRAGSGAWS